MSLGARHQSAAPVSNSRPEAGPGKGFERSWLDGLVPTLSVALVFDVLTLSLLFAATEISGLTGTAFSALAPLTAAASVFFYIRTFRLSDELHRRIFVDAMSLTTLVIALGAVLIASWMKPFIAGSAPHHWVMAIYVVFIVCTIVVTMRRTPEVFTEEFGGEEVEP
jgi:hypothetical protein